MERNKLKTIKRKRRKTGIRKRIFGTPERPRLTVFRSSRHIYVQLIDDLTGRTLASASTVEKDSRGTYGGNLSAAALVGKTIAERAAGAGVKTVVFDRNGFRYHGRVKAVADAMREGGLKF